MLENIVFLPRLVVTKEATVTFYSAIMCYINIKPDPDMVLCVLSSEGKTNVFAEEADANAETLVVRTLEVRAQDTHSELINQRRSRNTGHRTSDISGIILKKPRESSVLPGVYVLLKECLKKRYEYIGIIWVYLCVILLKWNIKHVVRGSPCYNWVPVDIMCVVKVISLCLQKRQEEDQLQGVNTGNKQVQTNKTLLGIYSTSKNSASTFWNHSKTGETRNVSDQNLYWYLIGEWTVMLYSHDRHLRLSVKWI